MKSVVVLLSGGLDSTVTLYKALRKSQVVHAVSIDYGQTNLDAEHDAKARVFEVLRSQSHKGKLATPRSAIILTHAWGQGYPYVSGGGVLFNTDTGETNAYVPQRNAIFALIGAGYAESIGAQEVWMGLCGGPEGEVDTSPVMVERLNGLLRVSSETRVKVVAPFVGKPKSEVLAYGIRVGAPVLATHSCFFGAVCGKCSACEGRRTAFEELGLEAP